MCKILKLVGLMSFLSFILLPGYVHALGMDVYVDSPSGRQGILKQTIAAFSKENPQVNIKTISFEPSFDGKRDVISNLKLGSRVNVVISSGAGNWDRVKSAHMEKEAAKIYIVGLGVHDQNTMIRMAGVTSVSGGEFYSAWDAVSLRQALSDIEKKGNFNFEVKVYKKQSEELTDYMTWRYKNLWSSEVYESGKRDKPVTKTNIFPARFNLASGLYDIKINYGHDIKWIEGVRIEKTQLIQKAVNFAKGAIRVFVVNDGHPVTGVRKRAKSCWYSEAYEAGKRDKPVEVAYTFPPEFTLVNGKYDIKVNYKGQEKWLDNVEVSEDKITDMNLRFAHDDSCPEQG